MKRAQRRRAVKVFNDLADELSLGGGRMDPKEVDKSQLETNHNLNYHKLRRKKKRILLSIIRIHKGMLNHPQSECVLKLNILAVFE